MDAAAARPHAVGTSVEKLHVFSVYVFGRQEDILPPHLPTVLPYHPLSQLRVPYEAYSTGRSKLLSPKSRTIGVNLP